MKYNFRRDILHCALYRLPEDMFSKELILYLDEHVDTESAIKHEGMMSVCMMFWSEYPFKEPSDDEKYIMLKCIINALAFAWTLYPHINVLKTKAKDQRNIMRGWRISNKHHERRIHKICETSGIELKK